MKTLSQKKKWFVTFQYKIINETTGINTPLKCENCDIHKHIMSSLFSYCGRHEFEKNEFFIIFDININIK